MVIWVEAALPFAAHTTALPLARLLIGQSLGVSVGAMDIEHFGMASPFWTSAALRPLLSLGFATALKHHPRG